MEEMKQWIEHHKWILQKPQVFLLAFMVGVCLRLWSSSENFAQRSLVEFVSHARRQPGNLLRLLPKSRL